MKKLSLIIMSVLLFALCIIVLVNPFGKFNLRQRLSCTFNKEVNMQYVLQLPSQYDPSNINQTWPMILFLHGIGEAGDNLDLVKTQGLPKIAEQKDLPFIIVSPQCPKDQYWDAEELITIIDHISNNYQVDTNRVYLTGLSMGGCGTWDLATAYPERFAAIAPICGGGRPLLTYKIANLPVWAFHGAKDDLIPLKYSEEMVEALKENGGNVKFTVYPDLGHDSWSITYDNPELYDWFLQHTR